MAYFLFTAGDTLGKWLQGGYQASQIILTINIVGFLMMAGMAVKTRGKTNAFKSRKWGLHVIRGTLTGISTILVFYALRHLPLSDFYGIVFLSPLWVALISFLFLKESIPPSRWIAIAVGFLGVLVIAGSEFGNVNLGYLATLVVSLFGAIAALMARHIGGDEPPTNFGLATHGIMVLINLPIAIHEFVMPNAKDMGFMLLYGVMTSLAMMGISLVFSRSRSVSQIAPLQYTQMLWGILFGWLIFDNTPTERTLAGCVLVVAAGIYVMKSLRRGRLMNR